MEFDLVIANGTIVDGLGRERYRADLGILNGRIAAIAEGGNRALSAGRIIDAAGKIVAPGFVDVNSHADWLLPLPDQHSILAPLLLQGITTVVGGNCGFSPAPVLPGRETALNGISGFLRDARFAYRWSSFAEFLDVLERDGLILNAAFMVGQNTLRAQVLGDRADAPAPSELDALREVTRQALRDGAFGFSGNLGFAPGVFAKNDELMALLKVVAEEGGAFAVHARAYTWLSRAYQPAFLGAPHNLRSVREMIDVARQTGVKLQYSHLLFAGRRTWRTYPAVLREFDRAKEKGLDVGFDAFPFPVGNAPIQMAFPDWFLDGFLKNLENPAALKKLGRENLVQRMALGLGFEDMRLMGAANDPELTEFEGLDFATIGRRLRMSPLDAEVHVARRTRGGASVLMATFSGDERREEALRAVLGHPLCAISTNAVLSRGRCQNPSSFGAYPRVLGRYSRDLGLFSLEEAVRRMTSYPAERIGLQKTGRIAEGYWADLVVFDPREVADDGWPARSDLPPSGIHSVLVSGELAAQEGQVVPGARRGRVLRRR